MSDERISYTPAGQRIVQRGPDPREQVGKFSQIPGRSTRPIDKCEHGRCRPQFDAGAARGLSDQEVRRRWPRFEGVCSECGERVIVYASAEHFVMGDW